MDAQYRKKALSEIQNRLLDDNSSIHTDSPALSADSDKPALSLSSADQTWFELSSDCSDEEKEQMIKAAAFIKFCFCFSDKYFFAQKRQMWEYFITCICLFLSYAFFYS